MSEEPLVELDRSPAMTEREWTLISRLNQICVMIARGKSREGVAEEIREEFALSAADAEKWLRKAEEYMASGAIEQVDATREMYHIRLTEIYGLAMEHAVKDQIEVTTKPTRVVVSEGGKEESRIITGQHTKIKPKALDTQALSVALKAAKEIAHIMGGRPNERRRGIAVGTVNVQVNGGELAAKTMEMTNEMLAAMIGAQVDEIEVIDAGEAERGTVLPAPQEAAEDHLPGGREAGEEDDGAEAQ